MHFSVNHSTFIIPMLLLASTMFILQWWKKRGTRLNDGIYAIVRTSYAASGDPLFTLRLPHESLTIDLVVPYRDMLVADLVATKIDFWEFLERSSGRIYLIGRDGSRNRVGRK